MLDKDDVEILVNGETVSGKGISISMGNNATQTVKFLIRNLSATSSVTLSSCQLRYDIVSVILSDKYSVSAESDVEHEIPAEGRHHISY